ncbi:hypothetical protein [Nocardiopsis sp. B62]|uniref:hypothetical protein n=1 Tax=Nocardiopsis sp. B62 TaxID=2824874 RepID=UPI001B399C7C|nr:hypothetical protein [Nocardiopsis sp. B62]MBQ1080565.1 hypothetical protein [Nocardiopsis sp. B62]
MSAPVHDLPLRLLSPENRLTKVSVWERARECAAETDRASRRTPFDADAFCRAANRGALVLAMAGDFEESERSCQRQARVLLSLVRRGLLPRSETVRVLQPWINLGRLRVIRGDWEGALPHFPAPDTLREAGVFAGALGPEHGLTPDEAEDVLGSESGSAFVTNTHVVETAKALARGRRADLLAAHVSRWRGTARTLPHVREASALLALRGGAKLPAVAPGTVPTLGATAIEVHASLADASRTDSLLRSLDTLSEGAPSADLVAVLRAGAGVLRSQDRVDDCARLLRRTADVCRELRDEAELFAVLRELGGLDPVSGAAQEALAVAADSGYAFVRAQAGEPPLPPAEHEPRLAVLIAAELEAESRTTLVRETP